MGDAMLLVLLLPQRGPMQTPLVFPFLIGNKHQWPTRRGRPFIRERAQDIPERPLDSAALESDAGIEPRRADFLARAHAARTFPRRMTEVEDEPRVRRETDRDLVGEKLRNIEAHKSIGTDILIPPGERTELGMEGEGLSSEPLDTVLDRPAADPDRPPDAAQAHGTRVPVEKIAIPDDFLGIVVEREGLGGEGCAAGAAFEAGDGSEGFRVVMACAGKPASVRGTHVQSAQGIGTKGKGIHGVPPQEPSGSREGNARQSSP